MSEDLIRYDILAQDALRGMVRKVLSEVARTGLPGEHHFYITFDTKAPGVRISTRLIGEYPEEMTIILQHQFWDLSVNESSFEVGLSFNGVPERLLIPFAAVKAFIDPSVQFSLQFEAPAEAGAASEPKAALPQARPAANPTPPAPAEPQPAPATATTDSAETETAEAETTEADDETAEAESPGADVVSLDAFRKKS